MYELFTSPVIAVPPVDTAYHRYCPLVPPDALSVRDAVPQLEAPVAVGAVGGVLICAITEVLVLSQVPLLMAT